MPLFPFSSQHKWICGKETERIIFNQLDDPKDAKFFVEGNDKETRNVTEEELDTIISEKSFQMLDKTFWIDGPNILIEVRGNSGEKIESITLRDFLKTLKNKYIELWESDPEKSNVEEIESYRKKDIEFCEVKYDGTIAWDYATRLYSDK